MTIEQFSALAVVTAAVLYLGAVIAHSAEWAALRGVSSGERAESARLNSDGWGRIGLAVTAIAALSHGAGVVARGMAADRVPLGNMYEFVTSALLVVVVAYLAGVRWAGLRWLGLVMTLLLSVGMGLAATVLHVAVAPLVPALHSVWFVIHIAAATLAAAAFNIGGLASIVYLLKLRAVRRAEAQASDTAPGDDELSSAAASGVDAAIEGSGGVAVATRRRVVAEPALSGFLARVPNLKAVDTLAYRAHAFGFPIWTFTIAAGSIWAEYAWGRYWGWDPKETWSLVTWVVYAGYLHARATAGWKGRNAAIIAVIGLATFWFNFIGVNLLINGLHSYSGI